MLNYYEYTIVLYPIFTLLQLNIQYSILNSKIMLSMPLRHINVDRGMICI